MPRYLVWNPDHETEDDGMVIFATDPAAAGEDFVSQLSDGFNDSFELLVADEDGVHYEVEISVDFTPHYTSWSRKLQ